MENLSDGEKKTIENLRKVLPTKSHNNPISRLNESCQRCQVDLNFQYTTSSKPGQFACEVECSGLKVVGHASNKKEAKTNSATELIKLILNESQESAEAAEDSKLRDMIETETQHQAKGKPQPLMQIKIPKPTAAGPKPKETPAKVPALSDEATTSGSGKKEELATKCVGMDRGVWREHLQLVGHKEKDSVVMLAIFALNTGTGAPKYQITDTTKNAKSRRTELFKVMCTWNMFFFEAEADTRLQAEQKAAFKMVNNIRTICGLEQVPERAPVDIETIDSSEIVNDEDIPEEIKKLLIKNESILRDKKEKLERKERLRIFCSKLACPVMPGYTIAKVDTEGVMVQVEVECSWLTLLTRGHGNTRAQAEEAAATAMIKDILKIIDKLNRDNYDVPPPSVRKESEPERYLMYPRPATTGGSIVNSVTITSNDYLCLQTEQYLNDTIIDFYLKYLQAELWMDNQMLQKSHIFSIFFYNRLTMKTESKALSRESVMYNNVKRWTKSVNIFEKDFIVIPINECDHWFVVIICFAKSSFTEVTNSNGVTCRPIMIVMDSLEDGLKNTVCNNLRTYLTMEWTAKMKSQKEFTKANMPAFCPRIPQQSNLTDCGLYLLQYVESFYQKPLSSYVAPLASLEDWFSQDCILRKRYDIAQLIRSLVKEDGKAIKFPDIDFGFVEPERKEVEAAAPAKNMDTVKKESPALSGTKRKNEEEELTSAKRRTSTEESKKLQDDLDYLTSVDWLQDY